MTAAIPAAGPVAGPVAGAGVGTVVAGIDVGNSTTEVVLVEVLGDGPPRPLAHDRAPTRGRKGSAAAARAAADLAARTARRAGLVVGAAAVAPQRAVETSTVEVERERPDVAPLVVAGGRARTPGRPGVGAGRPIPLGAEPPAAEPVVLVVPPDVPFRDAAARVTALLAAGAQVTAVLLGADEGVLLAARVPALPDGVPVADGADTAAALRCTRLLVEVAPPDGVLRAAVDPLLVAATFALTDTERPAALGAARVLADARSAVVGLDRAASSVPRAEAPARAEGDRDRDGDPLATWLVDLDAVVAHVEGRRGPEPFGAVLAGLEPAPDGGAHDVSGVVAQVLGVPVAVVASEAAAARAGALTTPGVRPDAVVLDLGGGTLDLVLPDAEHVAAGAGELVTAAVARLAGCSRGAADWVKRGPSSRLEGPHVLVGEDGERRFVDRPAPSDAVGSLVVPGPAGLLPFARGLDPSQWRALRLRAKRVALGDNVSRLVAAAGRPLAGRDVVLVGGVAGDAELLRVLDTALTGCAVGRADVAGGRGTGALGHRWAVAYGLTVLSTDGTRGRLGT
ncbi:diol dehydratase reactivase ATPase-like domain-containing protein [Kineosporia sp. R_H_3]|uniref:diol dehydratase reactivase ATPase-like domain-containing protein n=1 Tax=Kineosporia sp. R_H_3 TaxID=1961848 RepID=UPI000B4BAE43|nr:diol dehydratase reactivase ATPase-like domain-containing protein [Kineosporia sp. R_H_3]